MIRSRFSVIGVLAIVMAGVVLAVHAQDTLTSDDCTLTTCFMDLRPGESTVQEVMNTIGTSPWVKEWSWFENQPGFGSFNWSWSDSAPAIFTAPEYPFGTINFNNGIVTDIQVKAAISPRYLLLLIGKPERFGIVGTLGGWDMPHGFGLTAVARNHAFWFTSVVYCPYYPQLWNADVAFIHWGNVDESYSQGWNDLTADQFIQQIKSMQQECR